MAGAVLASWPRRARTLEPLLPLAYGVVALIVVGAARARAGTAPTTYAGVSPTAYTCDLVAGLTVLAATSVALLERTTAMFGRLALLAGVVWFAQDWEGWSGGPAAVRSVAAAAGSLLAVPVALLVARASSSRRLVIAAAFGSAVLCVTAVGRSLVRDPLFDPYCWRDCVSRTFVVHSAPGFARGLDEVGLATTVALGVLAVGAIGRTARTRLMMVVPGALTAVALAGYAAALLHRPLEDPRSGLFSTLFYARTLAFVALGAGLVLTTVRRWRQLAAVSHLASELGAVPDALSTAFGDPTLEVAYWLPDANRYVDAGGRPVDPPAAANGRSVTPIVRSGRPVALVSHDASLAVDSFELGSAARLALENERLQAEVHAQLEALRESRMRITERGDAERRRLERDLHDGAQQRLLALSYDLRLARATAEAEDDTQLAAALAAAVDEAQAALEELRELAHGIYPAVLTEAGLAPALATLADESPVAVEISAPEERYDAAVEAALYVAVREAIDDAAQRAATWVGVTLDGRIKLGVEDDGSPRSAPLVHVADRVGALGGETVFGATSLHAEIPCA